MEKTLGMRILEYRAEHNISAITFAGMAHVTPQTIYSIENNTQSPSKLTRCKIEKILNEKKGE